MKLSDKLIPIIGVTAVVSLLVAFGFTIHSDSKRDNARWAEIKANKIIRANAECKVLREKDTPLIGVTCVKLSKDLYRIKTMSGVRVEVHSSRVVPNGENGLLKPYKEITNE